jgi:hypothetical protein
LILFRPEHRQQRISPMESSRSSERQVREQRDPLGLGDQPIQRLPID